MNGEILERISKVENAAQDGHHSVRMPEKSLFSKYQVSFEPFVSKAFLDLIPQSFICIKCMDCSQSSFIVKCFSESYSDEFIGKMSENNSHIFIQRLEFS